MEVLMKRANVLFMVVVAIGILVATVYAADTDLRGNFQAQEGGFYETPTDTILTERGLYFSTDTTNNNARNYIMMGSDIDMIIMGPGWDAIQTGSGNDLLAFGDNATSSPTTDEWGIITWDAYPNGFMSTSVTNSKACIIGKTPDTNPQIVIRGNDVVIELN